MDESGITIQLNCLKRLVIDLLLISFVVSSLAACNAYGRYEGVTFISSRGQPPAESIVWSPIDSNQVLVIASDLNHHNDQLFILDTTTLEKSILRTVETGKLFGLAWSPHGNRVLFARTSGFVGVDGHTSIISTNGNDEEVLLGWVSDAAWSPDGKTIAFFSYGKEIDIDLREINLHLMDLSTRADELIWTFESNNSLGMGWSPDGRRLVFALGSLKSSNLFVFDVNTQETIQITKDGFADSPVWSPSGDLIAYQKFSGAGLGSSLALIRSDGSCEVEIPDLSDVGSPTWLPDGKRLGFVALDGIYILDLTKIFIDDVYQRECPEL